MISFHDACTRIAAQVPKAIHRDAPLLDALGHVLAHELRAPLALPPFDNSAVDGYALASSSLDGGRVLLLGAPLRANKQHRTTLLPHTAMKIMTGAPLPDGANAVAMIEDAREEGDRVIFNKNYNANDNVRLRGEDIEAGTLFARAGAPVTPQLIALAAGLGFTSLPVQKSPRIKIIATGDELVRPGEPLLFGQVYFLMDAMLKAQCLRYGITDVSCSLVADDKNAIANALGQGFDADMVLLTGGMSKGDYDFARHALHEHGVEEIFYEGAWRPGKPLYFGRRGNTLVFGLPGNPIAAFVCFRVFVARAFRNAATTMKIHSAVARNDFSKKVGFTFFARAFVDDNNGLKFLPGQGSHQLFSLSAANALCVVPEAKAIVKTGEVVHYYSL